MAAWTYRGFLLPIIVPKCVHLFAITLSDLLFLEVAWVCFCSLQLKEPGHIHSSWTLSCSTCKSADFDDNQGEDLLFLEHFRIQIYLILTIDLH